MTEDESIAEIADMALDQVIGSLTTIHIQNDVTKVESESQVR